MTTSDWITIVSMVISIAGGYVLFAYKVGGFAREVKTELKGIKVEITSLSHQVSRLEKQMRKVLTAITTHKGKIKRLEKDVSKLSRALYKP